MAEFTALSATLIQEARARSWILVERIRARIQPGMSGAEAEEVAKEESLAAGSPRFWHRPMVRLGANTRLPYDGLSDPAIRLAENDVFYVDLGPVWEIDGVEVEGDVGDTFIVGRHADADRCARETRELFEAGRRMWLDERRSGVDLYAWLKRQAAERGWDTPDHVNGHALGEFPHKLKCRTSLGALAETPVPGAWVLEVQLQSRDGKFGAFFEDVLIQ